jgi:transposase InsO family protein
MPLAQEAVRDLAQRLEAAPGRVRAALKKEFMTTYGCSSSTLSRALNEVGVRCHKRADAGTRRKEVPEEILQRIAALQRASLSLRKGVVMPAEDAINIAEDSGWLAKGEVTPAYFNAWLREQDASRRDQVRPEPHVELRSLGPNHVHQVDFSLAVNWKVFQGKPQYEHLIYKNKLPGAGVPRLYRLLVVDHATGCYFAHYTESTGETVQATLEGLYRAWAPKQLRGESIERLYPFRGVPRILMADRGSANQAGITASVLERLGVQLNICEGARSKGAVEVSHGVWEQHFESRLRLQPPESVEQLNEWAVDFAARQCAVKTHTRHGATRSAMWVWHINRLPETQLRELRCSFEEFKGIAISEPTLCRVSGSRIIRFKSHKYRVPEQFLPGERVAVQYSPFEFPQILVRAADVATAPAFLCEPVELDEFGFVANAPVIGQQYKA